MHTEMWEHPAVQENLRILRVAGGPRRRSRGRVDWRAATSEPVASPSPERIVAAVESVLAARADLAGLRLLVTAGGTREAIDPVRVITNRSSGKQGYAVAAAAAARGASVTLVTTVDRPAPPGVTEVVPVASAADMEAAVMPRAADQDVIVMAAAVADFRPKVVADRKIKKGDSLPEIVLEPTHDFLVDLGRQKPAGQVLVGFAAETDDVIDNAEGKLRRKHLDLIVANDVSAAGAGFEHDTNEVVIVSAQGDQVHVPLSDKRAVADAILDAVIAARSTSGPA